MREVEGQQPAEGRGVAPWGPVFKEVLLFQLCGSASGSCRPGGGRGADSLAVAVLGPLRGSTEAARVLVTPGPSPTLPARSLATSSSG